MWNQVFLQCSVEFPAKKLPRSPAGRRALLCCHPQSFPDLQQDVVEDGRVQPKTTGLWSSGTASQLQTVFLSSRDYIINLDILLRVQLES